MSVEIEKGLISANLPHIFYGGDYNPDQWPEEIWQEDVKLMREAGVNLVSVAIFSWSRLEPRPGEYDFEWLDRVLDLLHENNIKVDLATATASPPPWLAKLYPESLPVTSEGTKLWPGSRQQFCPSSPAYREKAQMLVRQIAQRYKNHPALVMWHINNEYGCHVASCYCDISAQSFRLWLKNRFGTIEALNEAWGTSFWSQRYGEWDEINPPRSAPTFRNPTQQLDFKRFSSDELLSCFEMERDILRQETPNIPITTNFMNFFKPMDYWKWAKQQDVISNDAYPDPSDPSSYLETAMAYDLMRSLGNGKPWVLMEQTTSRVNWRGQNALKKPGQMRMWSYQAVARGANGVMFFQWRASKAGSEKFHGALVPHVGTENSYIWREVSQLGRELGQLDALLDAQVKPEVAILFDWESWWSLELETHPSSLIKQLPQTRSYYEPLLRQNIAVDFVHPDSDFSKYKIMLVPQLYLAKEDLGPRLEKFVSDGGTLVMSFFSGIANQNDHIYLGGYPGPFRKVLGLWIEDFEAFQPDQTSPIAVDEGGQAFSSGLWADFLHLEGAEVLAQFKGDYLAQRPAILRHKFGQGQSYYLATQPDAEGMSWLLEKVCREANLAPSLTTPAGVEAIVREKDGAAFLFLINHNAEIVELKLKQNYRDLLSGNGGSQIRLEPYGVAILVR